jgi:iron complex outermembrane recepter protein
MKAICYVAAFAMALYQATAVRAQEHPDTITPIPVEPVVATVLRMPVTLTAAPFSISTREIGPAQQAQPGLALDEVLRGIPGLQVDNRHNYAVGERITLRGSGARAPFGVRGIKILVDGVPATLPDGQTTLEHLDLSLIERVQVIRGPAASIYGNAAGGVIDFETRMPDARSQQRFGVVGGAHDALRLHGGVSGRTGSAAYALNAGHLSYDGFRDFSKAENLFLNGRYAFERGNSTFRLQASFAEHSAQNPGSLSEAQLAADRYQAFENNVRQQTGKSGQHVHLGARLQHRRAGGEWDVSGYLVQRSIENPIPARIIDLRRSGGGVRALYHAAQRGPGVPLRWTLGAEADGQWDDRQNYLNRGGDRGALDLDQRERVANLGTFAQASAELSPRLFLMGGVRYDLAHFRVADRFVTEADPDDSGYRQMAEVSPSVGLTFGAHPALKLFVNTATAFETPTTTELVNRPDGGGGFNPELSPQRTLSAEAGVRGDAGGFGYHLAVYRAWVRNALIPFEVPDQPSRQFFRNAGSTLHSGVELALSWQAMPGLRTELAHSLISARFSDFATAQARFDGNRVPGIAPQRTELRLGFEPSAATFLELDLRHVGRVTADNENAAFSPAYTVADARMGMRMAAVASAHVQPFVGVTNLFDARYNASVVVNAFGGRYFEPAPGRAFYAGANVRLGRD